MGLGADHVLLRGVRVRYGVVPQALPVGLHPRLDDHPAPADVVGPRKLPHPLTRLTGSVSGCVSHGSQPPSPMRNAVALGCVVFLGLGEFFFP